jgi:anti-sigma regulatory factor (Ser/Thr protein kinase)
MGVDIGHAGPLVLDLEHDVFPPLSDIRQWVDTVLQSLGEDHRSVVVLVVNELVTNAYEHGGGPSRLILEHGRTPCYVRVAVPDTSPERPTPGRSRLGTERGRGITLVERLSRAWGVDVYNGTKTVWAEIYCDGPLIEACDSKPATPPARSPAKAISDVGP